ncbi:hypothetical protein [Nitrospira defluvii]|uniref:Rieske domain-containing protein n=1 Tax=Nitrospira defluvii TaxID=330214 RepID=A0ABM8R4X3_9BACT|nr:hypothetical protein [Nitrospira defluvii]CAE6733196.1 hypothetical protein NSPZN2_100460 [Nitrospira defluvii]
MSKISQLEGSTAEFCNLPARSAGLSLRCQVRNAALVRSGECPHRGREAATLGQSGVLPLDLRQPKGSRLS